MKALAHCEKHKRNQRLSTSQAISKHAMLDRHVEFLSGVVCENHHQQFYCLQKALEVQVQAAHRTDTVIREVC